MHDFRKKSNRKSTYCSQGIRTILALVKLVYNWSCENEEEPRGGGLGKAQSRLDDGRRTTGMRAQGRLGGGQGASRQPHTKAPARDRAQGGGGAVGEREGEQAVKDSGRLLDAHSGCAARRASEDQRAAVAELATHQL